MNFTKNQLIEVDVVDVSSDGAGIGKVDSFPFFIKDAIVGDKAQIRVTKLKKNYGFARLEKVLTPSPFRVNPQCSYHKQCGGCQIQAMHYDKQLELKESKIRNNLIRIGGFSAEQIKACLQPIVGMEEPFHYRNKAQYPIGTSKEGQPIAGFYAGRTHDIIANTKCLLGCTQNKDILECILAYMRENHVSAYDETTGKGLIRHILIRKGFDSEEIMVCIVLNYNSNQQQRSGKEIQFIPTQESLVQSLKQIPNMTSVSININAENTNVILGSETYTIWGRDTITDTIYVRDIEHDFIRTDKGITFSISPLSFYQVNPVQTEKLYSLALNYAGLTGQETVWDLYCGIGTISLFLAAKAKQVYGVEVIPEAIADAQHNTENNNITNAQFFVGKAEEVLPEKYEKEGIQADVIVVDPPRKGCDSACLETMLKIAPKKIIYVSCDSATLARDLRILCDGGYELVKVRGVDLFPMTVHVETIVALHRTNS